MDKIQDATLYGLFPEFKRFLDREVADRAILDLGKMDRLTAEAFVASIPPAWDVNQAARDALVQFILQRASFVAGGIIPLLWPGELPFPPPETQP